MIRKEPTSVQLSYGIPYRRGRANVEFCLFVFPDHRDWEFPQSFEADEDDDDKSASLLSPCREAGFDCRLDDEPLGHFEATRGDVSEAVTTYLVEVTNSDAAGGGHPRAIAGACSKKPNCASAANRCVTYWMSPSGAWPKTADRGCQTAARETPA